MVEEYNRSLDEYKEKVSQQTLDRRAETPSAFGRGGGRAGSSTPHLVASIKPAAIGLESTLRHMHR